MNTKNLFFGVISLLAAGLLLSLDGTDNQLSKPILQTESGNKTVSTPNNISPNPIISPDPTISKKTEISILHKEIDSQSGDSTQYEIPKHTMTLVSSTVQTQTIEKNKSEVRYLAYQDAHNYMRQGGVRARFEMERHKREALFRKKHEITTMPQQQAQRNAFLKQQQRIQARKQHILRLREKQTLQQDFGGKQ